MKLNIRKLFRYTDEATAQRIAELCPPVSDAARERIFRNALERAETPVMQAEETFHVETIRPVRWRRFAAAAACIALVGTAVIGFGRYAALTLPPPEQPAASEAAESCTTETIAAPTQDDGWTQQEVYALCRNAEEFLRGKGRFSLVTCSDYPDSGHSLRSEVSADLSQEITCVISASTQKTGDGVIELQENLDYCAAGYEISLVDYASDTPDIGTCRMDEDFALPAVSKTAGSAFYGEMLLSDFSKWKISGTDTYLLSEDYGNGTVSTERPCIVVDISDDTTKLCADAVSYQLLADAENGMWLSLTGYDANGEKIYEYRENDLKYGDAAAILHPYDVGEKIRQGDYVFETDLRLEDLPEVYRVHPSNSQTAETTTTAARCLYQTNLVTIFTEKATDSIPETEQTMTTPQQTMTIPVQSETTTTVTTQKQTETVKTSETTTTTTTASGLTEEQQKQLEELRAEGDRLFGRFVRQELIIRGELPEDTPRLTLAQMEEMIAGSTDFNDILQTLLDAQLYPDFVGGSGVTNIWYWLDETGSERILITLEQEDIHYESGTEDCYERLYG